MDKANEKQDWIGPVSKAAQVCCGCRQKRQKSTKWPSCQLDISTSMLGAVHSKRYLHPE